MNIDVTCLREMKNRLVCNIHKPLRLNRFEMAVRLFTYGNVFDPRNVVLEKPILSKGLRNVHSDPRLGAGIPNVHKQRPVVGENPLTVKEYFSNPVQILVHRLFIVYLVPIILTNVVGWGCHNTVDRLVGDLG